MSLSDKAENAPSVPICFNRVQSGYYVSFIFFKHRNPAFSPWVSLLPSKEPWPTGASFPSDRPLNDSSCFCHIIKIRLLQLSAGWPEWGALGKLPAGPGAFEKRNRSKDTQRPPHPTHSLGAAVPISHSTDSEAQVGVFVSQERKLGEPPLLRPRALTSQCFAWWVL